MVSAQNDIPAEIAFDEGQPFFDYVSAYVSAISGLESMANPTNLMYFGPGDVVTLLGKVHPVLKIGQLAVHQQFVSGKISSAHVVNSLACMLANTAFESVKHWNDHSPEFELFRHVRHAASHGNRFHFNKDEPRRPAAWRGLVIDHGLHGDANTLQGEVCFGNLLAGADVILLLWDIEQKLIDAKYGAAVPPAPTFGSAGQ
jgi:hypothetical protein